MRKIAAIPFVVIVALVSMAALGCSEPVSASDPTATPVVLENPRIPELDIIAPGPRGYIPGRGRIIPRAVSAACRLL